jgi:hypothetical protein
MVIQCLEQIGTHFKKEVKRYRVSIAMPDHQRALQIFQNRYQQFVELWLY